MSVALCTAACEAAGFLLAGVEYAGECFCGNAIANGGAYAGEGCNMLCNGNASEYCGGPNRLNVYNFHNQAWIPHPSATYTTSSAVSTATATVSGPVPTGTGPVQPEIVDGWYFYGCQSEATGIRALSKKTFAADTMTLEACAAFCTGYKYWGTEYARECYCGDAFEQGSVERPVSECNFPCMGAPTTQLCGAGDRLSVYSNEPRGNSSSSSSAPVSTVASSTAGGVATSTSVSTSVPTQTGLPAGWAYQGCWWDNKNGGRALTTQIPDSAANSPGWCIQQCEAAGFSVAGTEYGVQCFCGDYLVNGNTQAAEADCNMACPGDASAKCGAGNRLSLYTKNGPPFVYDSPAPQTTGLDGDWVYDGCWRDNVPTQTPEGLIDQRVFPWHIQLEGTATPKLCMELCKSYGYAAAGLEFGHECWCGDPQNLITYNSDKRPDSECDIICEGLPSAHCGGLARLTTYFWTGATEGPLYEWDFPQGAAAGEYQHIANGPTIPLMTMLTTTGKVSFISKHGTGPANETGAYELDMHTLTFRELNLQTDTFCAAGVILPDKVGRQLTVGGWSGESTYGMRLYWDNSDPSGLGGFGTNDWQENFHELSLQQGRWYPSVMVMTNGSLLVIGGEIGSNDIAVPTIEVVPKPEGGVPYFAEWLERTWPNNLYPFLAITPSGGILVCYYNEARILDPVTFETTKVLPLVPGAVNSNKGGRTYPLEGAMALLPQEYPYDPTKFGVLMCGGSTEGPSDALDNCVHSYPESDDPSWIIERMPSQRVLSCISPLPDGTYLIVNGAHHGVAGFGLATRPNLNAVLYDPKKPLHKRMSVLANTTIARMYHSEAITLLDGRVLISGSNPEDGKNPEEYRVEVFVPPYLMKGIPQPTFTITNKDWAHGGEYTYTIESSTSPASSMKVSLLAAVSSTHGNSMNARTIFPKFECTGNTCTVTAPPDGKICPPGWYAMYVLDNGVPSHGQFVRIGGDPAGLGNWPPITGVTQWKTPGV